MTDRELLCKEFTELTGGRWHCFESNKFYNPADVLKVMLAKLGVGELETFLYCIGYFSQEDSLGFKWLALYIMEPDALLKAAVTWLKENKNEQR